MVCIPLALSIAVTPALAAWPNSPFIGVPVCTATASQAAPYAVSDGAGGALLVWTDPRTGAVNDIYAHHVLASGMVDPAWPAQGLAVCTATGSQSSPVAVSDGAGGMIIAWQDSRSGTADVYAHHVLASGSVDPAWPVNGRGVCTAIGSQSGVAMTTDGGTGAIIIWQDDRGATRDVYAHHVLITGLVDAAWPADGRALVTATGIQQNPAPVPDGAGGAVVAWEDSRAVTSDIYAQRVLASGVVDAAWPLDGRALCTSANGQSDLRVVSDGAGGMIATWEDPRSGVGTDIYAMHVLVTGATDVEWPANGALICGAANGQDSPKIASDGAGGAIVAWEDNRGASYDIYAQHVDARGDVDPVWPADGRALCNAAALQSEIAILSDGFAGAIVAWKDDRTGTEDVYATHVLSSGVVDPAYPLDGRAVSTAAIFQESPTLVDDGNGGVIAAWRDSRSGTNDIYAARIGRHGFLGTPEPELVSVGDVSNDEGGAVKLSWNASYLDQQSNPELDVYDVLRSVPTAAAGLMRANGARIRRAGDGEGDPRPGDLLVMSSAAATEYWEFLGSVTPRHYLSGYSYVAPTLGDSVGGSNPSTAFMVVGRNSTTTMWWPSRSKSGYSVDDLAPAAPAPLTGQFGSGTMHLYWNPNTEPDLAGYRLYRGSTAGFVPGPGNLIAAPPDTGYADPAGSAFYYKLSAVDVHGNESPVATLSPTGLVGVDPPAAADLSFATPSPNPASRGVSFRFMLPAAAHVRLSVFDAGGRLVRELASGSRAAGEHIEAWDLRDADGRAAGAGLYFARLDTPSRSLTRRIAVTR
jgi:hypothetical protein